MSARCTSIRGQASFDVWYKLRSPFTLCASCVGFHTCQWETIDTNMAGCTLCSARHVCSIDTCQDVVQTEDALVCSVTGMCVSTQNLVLSAHTDTTMVRGQRVSGVVQRNTFTRIEIAVHVAHLLSSDICHRAHTAELQKLSSKIISQIGVKSTNSTSIFKSIELAVSNMKYTRMVGSDFAKPRRLQLVEQASMQLTLTISSCCCFMPSVVRGCDLRTLVYGLLYLMRTGITVHNVCFLPVLKELEWCLPTESNLTRFFDFKAKHITEIENRFKFMFRTCTRTEMHRMGFHEAVM